MDIQNIELWAASPHFYVEDIKLIDIKNFKRRLRDANLKLVCFTPEQCVYPINIAAKEDAIRERSLKYFFKSMEIAAELGSPILLVTPGWGYFSETKKEAWLRSLESLRKLGEMASDLGINLALEPLSPTSSNIINDVKDLKKMLVEINSPNVKGMIDTVQMAIIGDSLDYCINELGKDLIHMHFVDGNPWGHLAWGDGTLPLTEYLDILFKHEYKGYISLEITDRKYYIEPEKAIQKSVSKILSYIES